MRMLDIARAGKYWMYYELDREFTTDLLGKAVPVEISNVVEWVTTDWLPNHRKPGVNFADFVDDNLRLSFPVTWFEYRNGEYHRAVLVYEDDDEWICTLWELAAAPVGLHLTHLWGISKHGERKGSIWILPEDTEDDAVLKQRSTMNIMLAQVIMHCKNVITQPKPKAPEVVRKWERKHAFSPVTYRTIIIQPLMTTISAAGGVSTLGIKRAAHIVRGNWATYTEEKPLFGKVVGKFFRPAHRRGDEALGTVEKKYQVVPPNREKNE
jgi:hypothetical protein